MNGIGRIIDDVRGDEHDRFRIGDRLLQIGKEVADQRDGADEGNACLFHVYIVFDQAADEDGLAVVRQKIGGNFGGRL